MKRKDSWIIIAIVSTIALLVGICIGVFIKNFPGITYENKVEFLDILTFLLTLGIGVFIPFFIKKWIDDNKSIKEYLVREVEELQTVVLEVRDRIEECYKKSSTESQDRDHVNYVFHKAELQIQSIEEQFNISFSGRKELVEDLKNDYHKYKDFITGGEFMVSDFKIDLRYQRDHSNKFNDLNSNLKKLIHKLHKI